MPEDSPVTMDNILRPHRDRTVRRMLGQHTVLCVQAGSDLNYNGLAACTGLGEIGSSQTRAKSRGLHLHTTLAIATNGLPLGVLKARCLAPEPKAPEDKRPAFAIPIEEKKTFVWIEHHRDMVAVAADQPAGDGAERHIITATRPANRQQNPNRSRDTLRNARPPCGMRARPHKRLRLQGQRYIGLRISKQFPRQRRRLPYPGDDLNARVAQIATHHRPQVPCVSVRLKDGVEKLHTIRRSMRAAIAGFGSNG